MLITIQIVQSLDDLVMQLFIKIVHTWQQTKLAKIRSWAPKTAMINDHNVPRNRNVVHSVVFYIKEIAIIA